MCRYMCVCVHEVEKRVFYLRKHNSRSQINNISLVSVKILSIHKKSCCPLFKTRNGNKCGALFCFNIDKKKVIIGRHSFKSR